MTVVDEERKCVKTYKNMTKPWKTYDFELNKLKINQKLGLTKTTANIADFYR